MTEVFFMSIRMYLKGIYADRSALFQLFTLLTFVLAGAIFSSLLSMSILFLSYGFSANMMEHPDIMRIVQFLSAIGTFLFPALGVAYLSSKHPKEFLYIGRIPGGATLWLTFICMFLLSPTISLTGLLNKQMELPACMAPIENWMREQENTAEKLTLVLLSGNSFVTLLFNLIVIAVTAGITEEFLFRGALQRIIGKWTTNHHLVIWSAAFLFSAFHMQFFGFLPRMLLGAFFGYLLYWSKNIWIPVFAHFLNNAFAVISMSDAELKDNEFITGDISTQHLLPYSIAAAVTFCFFYICSKKLRTMLKDVASK